MLTQLSGEAPRISYETPITIVTKGQRLLREGLVSNKAFIIRKGLFRTYYYEDHHEINHQVFSEGDILLPVRGLYLGLPSKFIVQALESGDRTLKIDNNIQLEDNDMLKKVFCKHMFQMETMALILAAKNNDLNINSFLRLILN